VVRLKDNRRGPTADEVWMRRNNFLIFASVAGFGLLADQFSKLYIDQNMARYASIPVIDHLFSITYLRNPGAAFGLFAGSAFRVPLLIAVSLAALVVILVALYKLPESEKGNAVALSCIFTGACGNLIDRIRLGEVIDFLDLYWKSHHWPAFNIADSAIFVGVFLYLAVNLREEREPSLVDPALSRGPR